VYILTERAGMATNLEGRLREASIMTERMSFPEASMRRLVLSLILLAGCWGCSPQASGPPQPSGGQAPLSSQGLTAPQEPDSAGEAQRATGHPQSETLKAPAESPQELTGTVVEVRGQDMFLARPSGVELRFRLPQDLRLRPEGRTLPDLVPGTEVLVRLRNVERGMEAREILFTEAR